MHQAPLQLGKNNRECSYNCRHCQCAWRPLPCRHFLPHRIDVPPLSIFNGARRVKRGELYDMAHQLADELLKEILWPPLVVPDQLFADTGAVSPFSKALYSAADVLLVCKRWMRVATPSLYHTVIIRSTAQAQALAAALTRNPEFGRYIKKLRIEGAYGVHLSKIAPVAPNIVHFCFSLSIWADSSPGGLLKLLSAIQPSRVILTTSPGNLKNKKLQGVVDKLCTCIPLWTKLVRTFVPRACMPDATQEGFQFTGSQTWHSVEFDQYPAIAHSLALSSSLQWVHIFPNLLSISAATLSALADSNTIRTFYVQSASISGPAERLWWMLPARMRSRAVVIHHGTTYSRGHSRSARAKQPAFVNPFYVPMSTAPHALRTKIWTLIFDFALEGKTSTKRAPYRVWYDVERYHAATARSLMLLSRSTLVRTTVKCHASSKLLTSRIIARPQWFHCCADTLRSTAKLALPHCSGTWIDTASLVRRYNL